MQLFVRNLSGKTLSIAVQDPCVSNIKHVIAHKTGIPVDEQRLLFGGKDLIQEVDFDSYGIQAESTLDLLIRLRGGEKKKRCQFLLDGKVEKCSNAALTIIGLCSNCQQRYCGKHRLPEEHLCSGLDTAKQKAFDENKARLEQESMAASGNRHNVAF